MATSTGVSIDIADVLDVPTADVEAAGAAAALGAPLLSFPNIILAFKYLRHKFNLADHPIVPPSV